MNTEALQELLIDCVRDIYDAEKQLVKALPKMAAAASSPDLAEGFQSHLEETEGQITRLEKVFELLETPAKGKPCKGMKGLLDEGQEALKEMEEGSLRDLAVIAAAQKVEHYEISAYGTARTIAECMGNDEVAQLLQQTQDEEEAADEKLTAVAMSLYQENEEEEADTTRKPPQAKKRGASAKRASA